MVEDSEHQHHHHLALRWFTVTPGDGTGFFADIVQSARDAGIFWTTSAGNDREAHWGGAFSDPESDGYHNFSGTQNINCFGPSIGNCWAIQAGVLIGVFLRWDDWSAVNQNYSLSIVRWNGTAWNIVATGNNPQNGGAGQAPTEFAAYVSSGSDTAYGFIVQRISSSRNVNMEIFAPNVTRLDKIVNARSLGNLSDAPAAMTVAALDVNAPYPQEVYSSEGPTNGPGGTATGGAIKPDIAGFANVSTESYGTTDKFNGTSAATPHVAGAAALVKSAYPAKTPAQIQSFLEGRAIDMGNAGKDTVYGYGRLYLGAAPNPDVPKVYMPLVLKGFPPVPAAPVLNAIENSDGDGNYTLSWNASTNATSYTLQEDDNAAFSSPETRYSGPGTSWNATGKAAGTYYYRVQASNTWGASGWSNAASVIVQPPGGCSTIPTLLSPTNGSSLNTIAPLYRWDNGNNPSATTLRLQVAKDSGFTHVPGNLWYSTPHSGVAEFRFSRNLDPATTYYWRAWLVCGDTQGPYSAVWSFTTGSGGTILPAPALVAPANGSTVSTTTVTLQWLSVSGAVEYLTHWRRVGQQGYDYDWVNDTKSTVWLSANTTYQWWVSARNDYAIGTDSETWQVTTPAGASSLSSRDLGHNIVVGDGSTSIISEERTNK